MSLIHGEEGVLGNGVAAGMTGGAPRQQPVADVSGALPAAVDYVVVGAGAAGCVLAARLSADPACHVLLLEGGGTLDQDIVAVPGRFRELETPPSVYEDVTPPQAGLGGRQIAMHTGRGLGGGSSVNAMGWFQGMPVDYDGWRAHGAAGWGWSDMLPYLRRSEDHELGASEWHGSDGPMSVAAPRHLHPLTAAFVAAGVQQGLAVSDDLNGAVREGVGLAASNIRDGRRWSVVEGYLRPAMERENLLVRASTPVAALVLEGSRVVGVRLAGPDGAEVRARRGVVVCAGAIRTPHLLMLAGIGPADHLRARGIDVVVDAPGVGSNLHDHPLVPTLWPLRDAAALRDSSYTNAQGIYDLLRRGPLSAVGQGVAVVRTTPALSAPDVQMPMALLGIDAGLSPLESDSMACLVALLTPHSRGTVRLSSADPAAPPVVDPRYLEAPEDLDRLRMGVRRLLSIFAAPPLAALTGPVADLGPEPDDQDLEAYIRATASPYWHLVGTARLGAGPDAVVDPATMGVHGVPGLFVADASVFPTITRGNTHAPTIAVAERASDLIARDG